MILCIAEKPSVSRELAQVLAPRAQKNKSGFLEGNNIVFAHARGHLLALKTPTQIDLKFKRWSYEHLPILPTKIPLCIRPGCSKDFQVLKKLLMDSKTFHTVVCATDAGREGQYIFDLIYQQAGSKLSVKRLWLSALTAEAIQKAWANMQDMKSYTGLSQAARLRSYADWYVGMNASPAVSLAAGPTISVGRVMTPTLKLIVDRTQENENFVPEDYYQVFAEFGHLYEGGLLKPKKKILWDIKNIAEAEKIMAKIEGQSGEIIQVKRERQKETPPKLFNLGDLQVTAAKTLGFTAQKTLNLAQKLYETHKCLSYPRTNSRHIDTTMVEELPQLVKAVSHIKGVSSIAKELLSKPLIRLNKNYVDSTKVTDHHCLLPTAMPAKWANLSSDEKDLFLLVVQRFLAIFLPAAEYDKTTVFTQIADYKEYIFRTTGRELIIPGWQRIYGRNVKDLTNIKEKEPGKTQVLASLRKDEIHPVTKVQAEKKQTKPRPLYDDGTMIKAMQNVTGELEDDLRKQLKSLELGTEATRAAIIEKLIKIQMVERKGKGKIKNLVATQFGQEAIAAICEERVKSPLLTAEWEMKLAKIEKGELTEEDFLTELYAYIQTMIETLKNTEVKVSFSPKGKGGAKITKNQNKMPSLGKCPFCGDEIVESSKAFGCSNWRRGCKFTLWKTIAGRQMELADLEKLIREGRTDKFTGLKSKAGKIFSAALVTRKDKTIGFDFN